MHEIGPQYDPDDNFKSSARLHQSAYRASVLNVGFDEYGNRLTESAGRALLNYYDGLGVREALRRRFPSYSKKRDADMLRSEHIPFNLLAPLIEMPDLTEHLLNKMLGTPLRRPFRVQFEWAPEPAKLYLGDKTSFDTYIEAHDLAGRVGVGIEVKYTERGYLLGAAEAARVADAESSYWSLTRDSGAFADSECRLLATDDLRQIWRNHLLGLAMKGAGNVDRFISLTIYPSGNRHIADALSKYRTLLTDKGKLDLLECTFERYISCISDSPELENWKTFLRERYIVKEPA